MRRTILLSGDLESNSAYSRTPHNRDYAELCIVCSPYSHPDPEVREQRFQAACDAAAGLVASGELVVCPVAHSHVIAVHGRLPTEWEFWARFDLRLMAACDEVVVLTLQGWRESVGVQAEVRIADELGKPVRYLAPEAARSPTLAQVAKEADG
jgi:hypothetical protein